MTSALVIFVAILLLFFLVIVTLPIGAATIEMTESQTAADAAALAGADAVRRQWVDFSARPLILVFPGNPVPPITASTGYGYASSYARINNANLPASGYRVSPSRGEVYADVDHASPADRSRGVAESDATAEMDIDFSGCRWNTYSVPSPPPKGPPFFTRTLICGDWRATYDIINSPGNYRTFRYNGDTRDGLFDDLEPRLVD